MMLIGSSAVWSSESPATPMVDASKDDNMDGDASSSIEVPPLGESPKVS